MDQSFEVFEALQNGRHLAAASAAFTSISMANLPVPHLHHHVSGQDIVYEPIQLANLGKIQLVNLGKQDQVEVCFTSQTTCVQVRPHTPLYTGHHLHNN